MDMKDVVRTAVLMDLYENLLTERQRNILNLYINEDYSLFEISELTGVTRQATHDTIKKSIKQLEKFEDALGIIKRNEELKLKLKDIKRKLNGNEIEPASRELDALISVL